MTVQDLITRLRTYLNDPQAIEFSDAELLGYINDILREISLYTARVRFQGFLQNYSVGVSAGTGEVPLPADFLKEEYVVWNERPLSETHPLYSVQSGEPKEYYTERGSLFLNPVPDTDGTIKIAYYPLFGVSSLDDTIPLPSYFEAVLLHGVTVKAKNRIELNPQIDAQLRGYIYRAVKDFMKSSRSWGNAKRMRAT